MEFKVKNSILNRLLCYCKHAGKITGLQKALCNYRYNAGWLELSKPLPGRRKRRTKLGFLSNFVTVTCILNYLKIFLNPMLKQTMLSVDTFIELYTQERVQRWRNDGLILQWAFFGFWIRESDRLSPRKRTMWHRTKMAS